MLLTYRRDLAVQYAHKWAYRRNPQYYNYDQIGGDCTNFVSQCLYAGAGVMDYTPTFGWYYINANQKAPAWTGVEYLANFLLRKTASPGPVAVLTTLSGLEPGDLLQLGNGDSYYHTPIVVSVGGDRTPETILVAAHTYDADDRPLSTYQYQQLRCLHILGVEPER